MFVAVSSELLDGESVSMKELASSRAPQLSRQYQSRTGRLVRTVSIILEHNNIKNTTTRYIPEAKSDAECLLQFKYVAKSFDRAAEKYQECKLSCMRSVFIRARL